MKNALLPDGAQVISITGSRSGVGKTLLTEHIVSLFPRCAAVKVSVDDEQTIVTDAEPVIMVPGKDTCRFAAAGAAHVVWVRAPVEETCRALRNGLAMVRGFSTVIIEGNSARGCIQPLLSFFVFDDPDLCSEDLKKSRQHAIACADVMVGNARVADESGLHRLRNACRRLNTSARAFVVNLGDSPVTRRELQRLIRSLRPGLLV